MVPKYTERAKLQGHARLLESRWRMERAKFAFAELPYVVRATWRTDGWSPGRDGNPGWTDSLTDKASWVFMGEAPTSEGAHYGGSGSAGRAIARSLRDISMRRRMIPR